MLNAGAGMQDEHGDDVVPLDSVARIDLTGPLAVPCLSELNDSCARIAMDSAARVVILRATSDVWAGWSDEAWSDASDTGIIGDPFGAFSALPQPTIAVVEGAVRDAGLELALCADIRLADMSATFAMPDIGLGRLPIAGGLQRLARTVGRAHALDMVLRGTAINAATARQWGLISQVAVDGAAPQEATDLATQIAQRGPIALRAAKEAVRRGLEMPLDEALRFETDLTVLLQTTADRAEGVDAFTEKRPPRFQGR
jgi:enoyl-CoA hydratase/carnithine racemase